MDREYQYYAPLIASGMMKMDKAMPLFRDTVYRERSRQARGEIAKMASSMKMIKKFKFTARSVDVS